MKRIATFDNADYTEYDFTNELLPELWQLIFSVALTSLQEIAQVSTKWRDMAYDPDFYKAIVPVQRFGSDAWEKYIGTVEKETCLPYCIFKDMARGEGFLTWVPDKVRIADEENILDTGLSLEKLVQNPIGEGHKTGFSDESNRESIEKKILVKRPHWVWIEKKAIGYGECYWRQLELIEKRRRKESVTNGADVSSLVDTLVTGFMEKIRSGKSCFTYDNYPLLWVRVKDNSNQKICVGFKDAGLVTDCDNGRYHNLAVLVARISYGRTQNVETQK